MSRSLRQFAHLLLPCFLLLSLAVRADTATPIHDAYAATGPWTVAVDAVTYASGQTGFVYRPVAGSASEVFPVVVWGNGSGAAPEVNYPELLRSIASHGFVVTATNHQEVGTGDPLLESLEHLRQLEAQAGYALHGQIDFAAVAAVGHSQGAGGSTRAAIHSDDIHTIVPLALPALASVSLYVFMIAWNEFLLAFMLLDDPSKFTLTRGIASLNSSEVPRQHLMAGAVVATVPIMALFLGLERFMTKGLTAGSVKG